MFRGRTIEDYYREMEALVRKEIAMRSDEDIIGLDATEYADYLFASYALLPVERDETRVYDVTMRREWREMRDAFGDSVRREVVVARVEYPILEHPKVKKVLELLPNHQTTRLAKFTLSGASLIVDVEVPFLYGPGDGPPSGAQEIGSELSNLEFWLNSRNDDINRLSPPFRVYIEQMIQERKEWVARTRSDFAALVQQVAFPLKIKAPSGSPVVSMPIRPELRPILKPPTPKRPEELVLKREDVLAIVELIKRYGRSLEAMPGAIAGLDEEDIRALVLAHLNGLVDGGATAETFSKHGKTDIHLNLPKGEILIAECKIWHGAKAYSEAIDQLFGYLTWRQCYGIIISFVRNRDFTEAVTQAESAITAHPTHRLSCQLVAENHLESQHRFPDDRQRVVEVHHLFFHFPPG